MSILDFSQLENYSTSELISGLGSVPDLVAERIVDILARRGEPAVLPLIEALKDTSGSVRYYAVFTLKLIGDSRAIEPLSDLLADPNDNVRILAALYLPTFGNLDFDRYKVLLNSRDWRLRSSGAMLLGQSSDSRATGYLLPLLQDENNRVSFDAMWALERLVNPAVPLPVKENLLPALIEATKDPDMSIRGMAAEILGNLGDGRAVEILTGLKDNDPETYVRDAAAKALQTLG